MPSKRSEPPVNDAESTATDFDEYVTLRLNEGAITVTVSPAGFRQPPGVIANLIIELAARLPLTGTNVDDALAANIDALDGLRQAAATGGYEAFAAMMRGRLGIDGPAPTLSRDPDIDRAVADRLDGVLKSMRQAKDARTTHTRPDRDVLEVEAHSDEGDLSVTATTERAVARVRIGPEARYRGIDGLGQALTDLIATARDELRKTAEARAREAMPDSHVKAVDTAPEIAEQTGKAASIQTDRIMRLHEALNRKAGH
jgi:DNA-binding protein YbaB